MTYSTLGETYYWKNKYEDAQEEIERLNKMIIERQQVIEAYQKHYAQHTFTKITQRLQI